MSETKDPMASLRDVVPTSAEVRACKMSLGREALARLQKSFTCSCGEIHNPGLKLLLRLVEDGYAAHREHGLEQRDAIHKLRGGP